MSEVFFVSAEAPVTELEKWYQPEQSLVYKLDRLIDESGILDGISSGDLVAIKTHFGDFGTTKTLRSVFLRKIAEKIKERGGKPFVTETTGLGMTKDRSFATGRLTIAEENGYTQQTLAAPVIIADGLIGLDGVRVNVNGKHLKEVFVAKAIAEADFVVVATHFKLHFRAGVGGSLKNIGVGCVTKTTKYDIHVANPPRIDKEKCVKCDKCLEVCPVDAIENYEINLEKCVKCAGCGEVCKAKAVVIAPWLVGGDIAERIVEAAKAVIDTVGKENFAYLNFVLDVTPHCDCHPYSGVPVIPDIGIFASKDIVSVDKASLDAYESEKNFEKALLKEKYWEWTSPKRLISYAEELGLGESKYTLNKLF